MFRKASTQLFWNKPERLTLQPGMTVSYRDPGQWPDKGRIISIHGRMIKVRWDRFPRLECDEAADSLYVWTEQPTDPRDVFQGGS